MLIFDIASTPKWSSN